MNSEASNAPAIEPVFFRVPEICSLLGCSEMTLYRLYKQGRFPAPAQKLGRSRVWYRSTVLDFLQQQAQQ